MTARLKDTNTDIAKVSVVFNSNLRGDMKRIALFAATIFLFSSTAFAWKPSVNPEKVEEAQAKLDAIEIIDGVPEKNRKYKTIGPVMGMCLSSVSMKCALKKMKKEALKLGADAIIKVEMGTSTQSGAGYGGGIFMASSVEAATVKGWAVKWNN